MRGRLCAYLVVDLAPSLILQVVVLESLQTVDADVEICGVENCDQCESASYFTVVRGSATYGLQL